MGRKTGFTLVGLGIFLVVLGLMSRFYAYGKLAVAPGDQNTVQRSSASGATVFDIGKQREVVTDLQSTQNVVGAPGASAAASQQLGRPIVVWETLVYTTKAGAPVTQKNPPLSANHDRVAFDAHTGQAVNCCGHFLASGATVSTGKEKRDTSTPITGLYYKFPFDAQKQTYKFWDGSLKKSTAMKYQDTGTIKGLTVYRYQQVIKPTKVATVVAPASFFKINKPGNVKLDQVYANTRTVWVEPQTGVIIRGQEAQHVVARYQGKEVATLVDGTVGYTDKTITDNVDQYGPLATQLKLVHFWLPVAGTAAGAVLFLVGIFLLLWSRRRPRPQPQPADLPPAGKPSVPVG